MNHWENMPEFNQDKVEPFHKINITFHTSDVVIICRFDNEHDMREFSSLVGVLVTKAVKQICLSSFMFLTRKIHQPITRRTKSIWYPQLVRGKDANKRWVSTEKYTNRYPIYIVSKNRANNGLTWRSLDRLGLPYKVIVEDSQYDAYAKVIPPQNLLVLPESYLHGYETCDPKGDSLSKGPGAARNFAMQHSIDAGFAKHWVLDDNLDDFHRLHNNMKVPIRTGAGFCACEDFMDRYSNIALAGMNYYSFCKSTDKVPPLVWNTRIYSCLLVDNILCPEWRGRYNEDTDLSLRVLKQGLCTVQFNAFLCGKVTTQRMRGGNSEEFYDHEGTMNKSRMLEELHPDVARVVWRFNRWHHHVDYSPFKDNEPQLKEVFAAPHYSMELVEIDYNDKCN